MPGVLRRGMWQYTPSPEPVVLDNGLEVNIGEKARLIEEKNQLFKARKQAMEYKEVAKKEEPKQAAKKK